MIEGDAGSGKTVIAATLFHHLKHDPLFAGRKIGLVYANPATRKELQSVFRCVPGKDQKEILCPVAVTKEHYDIIICDEAQRLRRNQNLGMYTPHFLRGNARLGLGAGCDELDWLLTNSDDQVFLYDEKQIANPADIPAEQFRARLEVEQGGTRPVALRGQMRIRAGERYVPYIYDVLYQRADQTVSFDRYEFRLFSSFQAMHQRLREKEAEMGLCRLSSGYAWKWTSKEEPARPDIVLDGVGIWWNQQTGGWVRNDSAKGEMGSLYSLVGLDLNYAGVVIGPDLFYDRRERKIKVNRGQFFDNKVKSGVSEEDLLRYVLNTYATLLTRGIYGTYVYVCDQALRDYLRQYIPAFE